MFYGLISASSRNPGRFPPGGLTVYFDNDDNKRSFSPRQQLFRPQAADSRRFFADSAFVGSSPAPDGGGGALCPIAPRARIMLGFPRLGARRAAMPGREGHGGNARLPEGAGAHALSGPYYPPAVARRGPVLVGGGFAKPRGLRRLTRKPAKALFFGLHGRLGLPAPGAAAGGGVVYDVGADWGYHGVLLATNPAFSGTVHAFEAAPGTDPRPGGDHRRRRPPRPGSPPVSKPRPFLRSF